MPQYTIAICNYNMAETLEESLESILCQIDERFEVLVVDDASSDESPEILEELVAKHSQLRTLYLEPDPNRKLGETRNISVRESNGEYVILDLDADDVYQKGIIQDFVYIFHQFERVVGEETVIQMPGMRIASQDFWMKIGPYRNLPVGGEDMDCWRRLLSRDSLIYIDTSQPHRSIGYQKSSKDLMKRWYRVAVSDFQTGITLRSYLYWTFAHHGPKRIAYYLLMLPVAYIKATFRGRYTPVQGFNRKGSLPEQIAEVKTSLTVLEEEYGVSIDRDQLSENGKKILL